MEVISIRCRIAEVRRETIVRQKNLWYWCGGFIKGDSKISDLNDEERKTPLVVEIRTQGSS